jgi:hypothetical protein
VQRTGGPNFWLPQSPATTYITDTDSEEAANLVKQNEVVNEDRAGVQAGTTTGDRKEGKKVFVEPAISVPVDVLEATTFFQAATSGVTN